MTIGRRTALAATFCIAFGQTFARAAQGARPARIGYLATGSPERTGYLFDAFREAMKQLGYTEGRDVVYDTRWANGDQARLPELARQLVALKPDVIVAPGLFHARAAQAATSTIPIVFSTVSDPVGAGLVRSLASPGGNLTGVTTLSDEWGPKLVEFIRETEPTPSRLGVLLGADSRRETVTLIADAAQRRGMRTLVLEAHNAAEIAASLQRMSDDGVQAVIVIASGPFTVERRTIADAALARRMMAVSVTRDFVEAGAVMSYGASFVEQLRQSAAYVHRILGGAKPSELPVEQASHLELVVNLKTAEKLGIHIPSAVLLRADEVLR